MIIATRSSLVSLLVFFGFIFRAVAYKRQYYALSGRSRFEFAHCPGERSMRANTYFFGGKHEGRPAYICDAGGRTRCECRVARGDVSCAPATLRDSKRDALRYCASLIAMLERSSCCSARYVVWQADAIAPSGCERLLEGSGYNERKC
jgi:hypothetical protein